MTNLLEQAFAEASKLSPQEQDAFANWILKELDSERRWQKTFDESQDDLAELADEALAEHNAGETQDLDPSQL